MNLFSKVWRFLVGRPLVRKTAAGKDKQYWDTKHPIIAQVYQGRPIPGNDCNIDMDVRRFIWANDCILKDLLQKGIVTSTEPDEIALQVQQFVVQLLTYTPDSTLGGDEFWLFPVETLARRRGDCEDGAILLATLLINALPESENWRVRVSAGLVQQSPTAPQGGHAYCSYCRTSDNEWVVLDWCYLQDCNVSVDRKPLQKDNTPYKAVWFSFNNQFAWGHTTFALQGRINKGI